MRFAEIIHSDEWKKFYARALDQYRMHLEAGANAKTMEEVFRHRGAREAIVNLIGFELEDPDDKFAYAEKLKRGLDKAAIEAVKQDIG